MGIRTSLARSTNQDQQKRKGLICGLSRTPAADAHPFQPFPGGAASQNGTDASRGGMMLASDSNSIRLASYGPKNP